MCRFDKIQIIMFSVTDTQDKTRSFNLCISMYVYRYRALSMYTYISRQKIGIFRLYLQRQQNKQGFKLLYETSHHSLFFNKMQDDHTVPVVKDLGLSF